MLDLIPLYFIVRDISRIASRKGLKPLRWSIYSILGWISFELIGIVFALNFFTKNEIFPLYIVGLIFAFTSYVIIKNILTKMPDYDEDDIDDIGGSN